MSILYIILLKVYCLLLRIRGYPSTFTPVVWPQHISNWQHHFLCSRRSTEHMYIGHYLYSFHAHGTLFCALSVRTIVKVRSVTLECRVATQLESSRTIYHIYYDITANRTLPWAPTGSKFCSSISISVKLERSCCSKKTRRYVGKR